MKIITIQSISQLHPMLGLKPPVHPLVTLIDSDAASAVEWPDSEFQVSIEYYMISQKVVAEGAIRYGRNTYDFSEGMLMFAAPGQVFSGTKKTRAEGWVLCFHPDLIRRTPLGEKISDYTFFFLCCS
jgi:hypothetical protein